jgi:two-component system LytT family response regulator
LAAHPEVTVVGEADGVATALPLVESLEPDLVFLDVQMPGASGFELLDRTTVPFRVIFVTAWDQYALRAFEVNALDYLLKPVHPERLARTLARLGELAAPASPTPVRALAYDDRVFIEERGRGRFLKVSAIVALRGADDYAELVSDGGQRFLLPRPLKEWEERLPERQFVRVHRSTIVNVEFIERIEQSLNQAYQVQLRGLDEPVVMSRRYAARVKARFA